MKKIVFLLCVAFTSVSVKAQTDSTKIKLEIYKDLHQKGLITDQEYELLKKKELNLNNLSLQKKKITPGQYRSKIIIGTIGLSTGISMIVSGLVVKDKEYGGTNHIIDYKRQGRALMIIGSLFSATGIAFIAQGSVLRNRYFQANVSGTSASLIIIF